MDTLFRLVSLQAPDQQSFNSSTTTTTTNSGNSLNYHLYPSGHVAAVVPDEECFNFFMDEEDFSSSSSKPHAPPPHHHPEQLYQPYGHHQEHHAQHAQLPNYPSTGTTTPTSSSTYHGFGGGGGGGGASGQFGFSPAGGALGFDFSGGNWAAELLVEAARAVAGRDSARVQHLMWMLNELSSPYGDVEQKLAAYFLQALFSRMTDSGQRCYNTLASASDKASSFDSTRKTILRFQELSPWTTFGHVAANAAIMEAFDGESNLHIVDLSNTFCTQWPTLLESLATRADDTPHLRLTTVISAGAGAGAQRVLKEIGARMEKFARLMGVPFKFAAVHVAGDPSEINPADLGVVEGEALAVNLVGALRSVPPAGRRREALITAVRSLNPKIITVVEEEADLAGEGSGEFVRTFAEAVRWFRVYFEALDEAFPRTSNERLALERAAGRAVVDVVARPAEESVERREEAASWAGRLRAGGFETVSYSEEVCDDVRALLRRYKEGWAMTPATDGGAGGMFLTWRDTPVVWASAWRPA